MTAKKLKQKMTLSDSSLQLAELMQKDPAGIELETTHAGENLVGIFADENITSKRFKNLNEQKINLIQNAIEDISSGVVTLRSSTLGLSLQNNQITTYVSPHGSSPEGTVIYSINWKNVAAFRNWRNSEQDPITQEDINNSIYYLTVEISRLMK